MSLVQHLKFSIIKAPDHSFVYVEYVHNSRL